MLSDTLGQDRTGELQRVRLRSQPLDHRCSRTVLPVLPAGVLCLRGSGAKLVLCEVQAHAIYALARRSCPTTMGTQWIALMGSHSLSGRDATAACARFTRRVCGGFSSSCVWGAVGTPPAARAARLGIASQPACGRLSFFGQTDRRGVWSGLGVCMVKRMCGGARGKRRPHA